MSFLADFTGPFGCPACESTHGMMPPEIQEGRVVFYSFSGKEMPVYTVKQCEGRLALAANAAVTRTFGAYHVR